jgi:two-component system, NarL family, nitrate/nitrite response regulator NarL
VYPLRPPCADLAVADIAIPFPRISVVISSGVRHLEDLSRPADPTVEPCAAARVLIVTDIRLYREGLTLILNGHPDLVVAGSAGSASDALSRIEESDADIVLLDMAMPEGGALARAIAGSMPGVHVVALAVGSCERAVLDCAESGVADIVLREASADDLVAALRSARSGELRCPPAIAAILRRRLASASEGESARQGAAGRLTAREREVLELMDEGLGNKAIARSLRIEVATVKNHVHNICEKLQVHRRGEAVARVRSGTTGILPKI